MELPDWFEPKSVLIAVALWLIILIVMTYSQKAIGSVPFWWNIVVGVVMLPVCYVIIKIINDRG